MKESAITANTTENGRITVTRYASAHLAEPLVQALLKTELQGSTAILTRDNTSAETVVGLLHREGYPARLIQSNDNFSLSDIDEVRFFIHQFASFNVIPHEEWKTAQSILQKTYPSHSRGRIVCEEIIRSFESVNPHARYRTDLEIFVRESRLEDFSATGPRETVCVSTMHKAKGREFDNVFLLVTQAPQSDEDKRLLYVAMTRARKNLAIHTTTNTFDAIQTNALFRKSDTQLWNEPSEVTRYLTHRDVWLDFFSCVKLKGIHSGSPLQIIEGGCTDARGQTIVRFSKSFMAEVAQKKEKGFALVSASVHFVLWWKPKSEDTESENLIKIILPEIVFRRE